MLCLLRFLLVVGVAVRQRNEIKTREEPPPAGGPDRDRAPIPVDWEGLARASAHPLRVSILEVLGIDGGRVMSPNELAYELQRPLSNTNYHVGALAKAGMVVLVREHGVRGATEHFYALPRVVADLPGAPSSAEFLALVSATAPWPGRGVDLSSRLGVDLGFDRRALTDLDRALREAHGSAFGIFPVRNGWRELNVGEAYRLCVTPGHDGRSEDGGP